MHPTLRPLAALAALAALAGCAGTSSDPAAAREPAPAARFEPGGGLVNEIRITEEMAPSLIGDWRGPYVPYDMTRNAVAGGPAGVATLYIDDVQGSRLRGELERRPADGSIPENQGWLGALTVSGHFMVLNAHALLFEQDGVQFLEADMMGPDGRFYRHRFRRVSG